MTEVEFKSPLQICMLGLNLCYLKHFLMTDSSVHVVVINKRSAATKTVNKSRFQQFLQLVALCFFPVAEDGSSIRLTKLEIFLFLINIILKKLYLGLTQHTWFSVCCGILHTKYLRLFTSP